METELKYLNDINTVCNQIIQGYDVYHNACVVVNYYNKYGYTEHFRELIGTEENCCVAQSEVIMWDKIKLVFSVIGAIVMSIINDIRYSPKYVIFEASFIENENLDLLHDPEDGYWVEVEEHQKTIDVVFYRSSTDRMRISPSMTQ